MLTAEISSKESYENCSGAEAAHPYRRDRERPRNRAERIWHTPAHQSSTRYPKYGSVACLPLSVSNPRPRAGDTTAHALGPSRIETWSACNAKGQVSRLSATARRAISNSNSNDPKHRQNPNRLAPESPWRRARDCAEGKSRGCYGKPTMATP